MIKLVVPFVLASGSPRRRLLITNLVQDATFDVSDVDEQLLPGEAAPHAVERLARDKAVSVSRKHPDALVLGADTIVVRDDVILGKPVDADDAARMLASLSGRSHDVFTGMALVHSDTSRIVTESVRTRVYFDTLSEQEIATYVNTGSPRDKAGAYGIQDDLGALFVRAVEGDYFNVVGLPLNRLYRLVCTHFNNLVAP